MKKHKNNILKLSLIAVFLFVFSVKMRSQSYISMLKNYSEWHVTNCFSGCATDKYYTIGDTIINSLHYTFLDLFHYNKNFVIREDTITQKVYMRLLAEPSTVKEYLLYDFSMQINDTISIVNPGSPYPKYAGSFVLDSIQSKPLVNKNHRYYYLHSLDTLSSNTKSTIWVEGIGSLCLINTPGAMPQINGAGQLSCFFNNGIQEYQNLDSIADCTTIYPLTTKEINNTIHVSVIQDFDKKKVIITSTQNEIPLKILIYNLDSKLEVYKENVTNEYYELNIETLNKGLMIMQIENKNGLYKTFKLFNP